MPPSHGELRHRVSQISAGLRNYTLVLPAVQGGVCWQKGQC